MSVGNPEFPSVTQLFYTFTSRDKDFPSVTQLFYTFTGRKMDFPSVTLNTVPI